MNDYNKELGMRIYHARKDLDLTMKELGKRVGLHESTVKRYEDGEIKTLDIEKIKEFARVLSCIQDPDYDDLFITELEPVKEEVK